MTWNNNTATLLSTNVMQSNSDQTALIRNLPMVQVSQLPGLREGYLLVQWKISGIIGTLVLLYVLCIVVIIWSGYIFTHSILSLEHFPTTSVELHESVTKECWSGRGPEGDCSVVYMVCRNMCLMRLSFLHGAFENQTTHFQVYLKGGDTCSCDVHVPIATVYDGSDSRGGMSGFWEGGEVQIMPLTT